MIKRQSHNAQLQQHCCTRSHSSCSNCPPSAAAHAGSRFCHSFTAPSIMRWSRRSHSSTMRWRSSSTFAIFPLLQTLSCMIPHISKHDRNSCWLLKTVVSTVSENLMPTVYSLYGKVCNVRRQNSCDKFYKVANNMSGCFFSETRCIVSQFQFTTFGQNYNAPCSAVSLW